VTRALDGLTVLDLATFVAAPVCATLLGEFGAEVIKVEQPGVGDDLRRLGRQVDGTSLWWLSEARNKKSITCNLRTPEGQGLIRRLAERIDIVTENFRPGTLERWSLGYEALKAINPGLIMVRISAFGQTGPYRERPSFGRIAAAVSGISYLSGYPDREQLNLTASSMLTRYWSAQAGTVYNLGNKVEPLSFNGRLVYEDECFAISANYIHKFTYDRDYVGGQYVLFRFTLKTLGEFQAATE